MSDVLARRTTLDGAARSGVRDVLPIILSLIPFGFTIGAAITASAFDNLAGWLGGPVLVAGAAHLAMVDAVDSGAGFAVVLAIGVAINIRFAVYSAGMVPFFADQPRWFQWVGPFPLFDQLFALVGRRTETADPAWFRRYWMGLTFPTVIAWTLMISAGMWLGPVVPADWNLGFAVPLVFVAMTVPVVQDRSSARAGAVAAIVAIVAVDMLAGLGVLLAMAAGILAGASIRGLADE